MKKIYDLKSIASGPGVRFTMASTTASPPAAGAAFCTTLIALVRDEDIA